MAIEYNNIYFNISRKPSSKYMMVAIPMYMYRIETNEFTHGLNFFQKMILKFKARPGISDEAIAKLVGLDPKLIGIVVSELQSKGFINEYGSLSDKGKEKLWEIDGIVINTGKRKIGYVFQFVNQVKLYQYYISKLVAADVLEESRNDHPKVITGKMGDGDDRAEMPFFLDELIKSRYILPNPDEIDIFRLIRNSNKKSNQKADVKNENTEKLAGQLALRFISEQPELVWLCTYVYLQEREDHTFEPDWRVMDPFGIGDSVSLKFYLSDPINNRLLESIGKRFADAKTIGGKIILDYHEQLNKVVENKLLADFSFGVHSLDFNLQLYIQAIVKNFVLQQNRNFTDLDASMVFSLNLQNALENILKQDKEKRLPIYLNMYNHFEPDNKRIDPKAKHDSLIAIYRQKLFSQNSLVPKRLLNTTNNMLSKANSLLAYLVSFILTYNFDNKSNLFKLLNGRAETIIEIAQLRNEKGHGQTSKERMLSPLTKDQAENYYNFIKSFINDYIQNQ